jgi:transcriptional regulator with XRE-family HTH domain
MSVVETRIADNTLADYWFRLRRKVFEQIKLRVSESSLTQRQLAHRLGKSESRISKWLHGQENVTLRTMNDIARAIDCRLEIRVTPLREVGNVPNYKYDEMTSFSKSSSERGSPVSATEPTATLTSSTLQFSNTASAVAVATEVITQNG